MSAGGKKRGSGKARPNPHRGEVALNLDGKVHVLRLSLGALARLEARLGADSLTDLVARFESGTFRAADLVALLEAGGAPAGKLATATVEGGPLEAARVAARLLRLTFAGVQPE